MSMARAGSTLLIVWGSRRVIANAATAFFFRNSFFNLLFSCDFAGIPLASCFTSCFRSLQLLSLAIRSALPLRQVLVLVTNGSEDSLARQTSPFLLVFIILFFLIVTQKRRRRGWRGKWRNWDWSGHRWANWKMKEEKSTLRNSFTFSRLFLFFSSFAVGFSPLARAFLYF